MKIHRFDGAGIFECIARATTSGRRAEVRVMNTMPMAISLSDDIEHLCSRFRVRTWCITQHSGARTLLHPIVSAYIVLGDDTADIGRPTNSSDLSTCGSSTYLL
jgi:hypothetical protein